MSYIDEVWDERSPNAVSRFAAPGFRRHLSAISQPLDLEGQITRVRGFQSAFPDVTVTVEDVAADGDLIAFRSTMRGTHRGEVLGIPPTGKRVEVGLLDLIRVVDGQFAEQWGGPDMLDLVRQLGGSITTGV